jgi:tRNA(Ile)-lysidine synthetase-like protein
LLGITKDELIRYAQARRLAWAEDASNERASYDRNVVRLRVLPAMAGIIPEPCPQILAFGERYRRQFAALREVIQPVIRRAAQPLPYGWWISEAAMATLPEAARAEAWDMLLHDLTNAGEAARKAAAGLITSQAGRRTQVGDWTAWRERGAIALVNEQAMSDCMVAELDEPTAQRLGLRLRRWQTGDVIQPVGRPRKKLKTWLTDIQVPSHLKPAVRVIADAEGRILWAMFLGWAECSNGSSGLQAEAEAALSLAISGP